MIKAHHVVKEFGNPAIRILHDINLEVKPHEFVSISGRSGSGKSTLLYLLSTLDLPTSGEVFINNQNIAKMNSEQLHHFRNMNIGFIFQFHYLLPELTALENILLPARNINKISEYKNDAHRLLKEMDISHVTHKLPGHMSGGEQQRVAIARALIMKPQYLFADELTGNLDSANGKIVMNILKRVHSEFGTNICLVTHEPEYSKMADREIFLSDGKIVDSL